ncbi:hypothetical protein V6N12_068545 [Hibiscus sabdariffa]|uniref:Uncharacterized protein n=1 Tax=Hibiscus sabdariffa TaxID=183260 RepID=A0ABR2FQS2_9ROSI
MHCRSVHPHIAARTMPSDGQTTSMSCNRAVQTSVASKSTFDRQDGLLSTTQACLLPPLVENGNYMATTDQLISVNPI